MYEVRLVVLRSTAPSSTVSINSAPMSLFGCVFKGTIYGQSPDIFHHSIIPSSCTKISHSTLQQSITHPLTYMAHRLHRAYFASFNLVAGLHHLLYHSSEKKKEASASSHTRIHTQ